MVMGYVTCGSHVKSPFMYTSDWPNAGTMKRQFSESFDSKSHHNPRFVSLQCRSAQAAGLSERAFRYSRTPRSCSKHDRLHVKDTVGLEECEDRCKHIAHQERMSSASGGNIKYDKPLPIRYDWVASRVMNVSLRRIKTLCETVRLRSIASRMLMAMPHRKTHAVEIKINGNPGH